MEVKERSSLTQQQKVMLEWKKDWLAVEIVYFKVGLDYTDVNKVKKKLRKSETQSRFSALIDIFQKLCYVLYLKRQLLFY